MRERKKDREKKLAVQNTSLNLSIARLELTFGDMVEHLLFSNYVYVVNVYLLNE